MSERLDYLSAFEPDAEELAEILRCRKQRKHQRNSRGGKKSHRDDFENAAILLALEAGEITEGQAMRALGVCRVEAREARLETTALGRAIALSLI